MEWFRLYAEFSTDPKVQMMSEAMQRRLVMLFCLECGNGIETFHVTERETSIAFALRLSEEETRLTKAEFLRRGFINEDWTLRNWSSRQYASDSSTERVRRHREAKKQAEREAGNNVKRSSNALEQNRTEQKELSNLPSGRLEVTASADHPAGPAAGNAEQEPMDAGQRERCPLTQIVALYHANLPQHPRVEKLTDTRAGYIRQRWREDLPSLEAWSNYFADVAKSPFLTGRANAKDGKPPFIADLEWLTRPGNFAKVAEGKYHR